MRTQRIVWTLFALSIALGAAPLDGTPVAPVQADETDDAGTDPCTTIDPYTGTVTVDPDCIRQP